MQLDNAESLSTSAMPTCVCRWTEGADCPLCCGEKQSVRDSFEEDFLGNEVK